MKHNSLARMYAWTPIFEGDDPAGDDPAGDDPTGDSKKVDVEKLIKENEELKKSRSRYEAELEATRKKQTISATDKERVDKLLSEERARFKSQEQLAREERERIASEASAKQQELIEDRDGWKNKYTGTIKANALTDAAVKTDVYNPRQVVILLDNWTRVVPVLDEGKETGEYEVRVNLPSVDEKGKPIQLDLSPVEALKKMSETDEYANLFKSERKGGFGTSGNGGGAESLTRAQMADPEIYRARRKAQKESKK